MINETEPNHIHTSSIYADNKQRYSQSIASHGASHLVASEPEVVTGC